jgi:hypothetical protein
LCNTVWRDTEALCGLGQRHEAIRDVGHEAATDLVAQADPPGRVRGALLGWQESLAQPAADGRGRDPEPDGGFGDRDHFAVGVGPRRGRDAGGVAHMPDARLGEREAGAGPPSLLGEDRGDLAVGVVLGEAADQRDRVLVGAVALRAAAVEADLEFAACPALPDELERGEALGLAHGHDHLA